MADKSEKPERLPDLSVEEMGGNLGRAQAALAKPMLIALAALGLILGAVYLLGGCGSDVEEEPFAVNPSFHELGNAPPCGTVLASWGGSTAYSNGPYTGSGMSCGGTGAYGYRYQCVELVMRHFKTNWGLSWLVGSAKYTLSKAPSSKVDVYTNGDGNHPPVPGDMIVWSNGAASSYGHVGLVTQVSGSSVEIMEQNVKGSGQATLTYDGKTVGPRWTGWPTLGWAHAKDNLTTPKVSCKYHAQNPSGPGATAIKAGQDLKVEIDFTNTGNFTWVNDTAQGISNSAHVELWPSDDKGMALSANSAFYHPSWINPLRITALDPSIQKSVAPGQTARFVFTLRGPTKTGIHKLYVIPTLAGKAHKDSCFSGAHFYFDVKPNSCSGASSQACGTCKKGTQTRSCNNGVWGSWSSCKGTGCTPKSTKACGTGGTQTCNSKCEWGTCLGSKCTGASSQACGTCKKGTQTRSCSNGVWGSWSSCTGAGCTPKSTKACGAGALQTCDSKCAWAACKGTAKVYRFSWNGIKGGSAKRDHFYQLIPTVPPGYIADNNGKPVFLTFGNSYGGKMVKIWRLYMGGNCMDHYYTIDSKEKDSLVKQGWKLDNPDNIGYCSKTQTTGSVPLYQTYNSNLCDHLYTAYKPERDASITNGYNTSIRTICYVWSP